MHPVAYLFDEIYRDYWGIPQARVGRARRRRGTLFAGTLPDTAPAAKRGA